MRVDRNEALRQRMAALDGAARPGGCEHCDATIHWTTISLGESRIDIQHEVTCPVHGLSWFGMRPDRLD